MFVNKHATVECVLTGYFSASTLKWGATIHLSRKVLMSGGRVSYQVTLFPLRL